MKKTLRFFYFFFFLGVSLTGSNNSLAQTGSWMPANADMSYPRTLLKASQIPSVQEAIGSGVRQNLYAGIYGSVNTSIPTDNTSSGGRRTRATFAKNAAFVLLMDRKPDATSVLTLSAPERADLKAKIILLLENINTNVEAVTSYTEWQWRSKELIDYMIAYDLLRGAGETVESLPLARTKLQEFAGNLHRQTITPYLGFYYFFPNIKNNHALMTAAALGLSAVVLNDVESTTASAQPVNWINTGLYHLDNVLWRDPSRQSDPLKVAGYAEGPYYFKYAFLNCLPFIRSMGNFLPDDTRAYTYNGVTRNIKNPYFDPSYDLLYDWITAIQMPDGRFPALEDSYIDMAMPELALTGKNKYLNPVALSNLASGQMNTLQKQLSDITVDMRAAFLAANISFTTPVNPALTVLPASGNLVFRSGNDSLAHYLHVYGKNGPAQSVTGGHNQGDASSFILHAKGQLLALDPGYLSSTNRAAVGEGVHHNLVLVDGAGPAMGTAGNTNDAEAFIQNTVATGRLSYGEVQTAYRGATITRKTLYVRNSYFLMTDVVSSTTARTYTWQLHGYGQEDGSATTGTFTDSLAFHKGTWHKNGVNLKAHVTATNGASGYGKATNPHEITWNNPENHTTLQVQKTGVLQTQFLSMLQPYVTSPATTQTISTTQTAALATVDQNYQDVAAAQADTVTAFINSLPEPLTSDALFTFYSLDGTGEFAQAFLEQGRKLQYGETVQLESSKRSTLSWQKLNDMEYEGYSSTGTILFLALESAPSSLTGQNVEAYSYDPLKKRLVVTLSGPSVFKVQYAPTVLPVALTQFTGKRLQQEVLLQWKTASEKDNKGFEIQRRSGESAEFKAIGFVPGQGTSMAVHAYQFIDKTAPATTVYYRLKQLDEDGKYEFSKVIVAPVNKSLTPYFNMYPVPANESVQLSYGSPDTQVKVNLLRADGSVLQQHSFKGQMQLSTAQLADGLYFLQILDQQGKLLTTIRKLVVRH